MAQNAHQMLVLTLPHCNEFTLPWRSLRADMEAEQMKFDEACASYQVSTLLIDCTKGIECTLRKSHVQHATLYAGRQFLRQATATAMFDVGRHAVGQPLQKGRRALALSHL